ncbi:amidase [Terriglobus tenax]|uniref:amidase n=1 Tax=Terriglobus tenax TaxID=1111115 RepID=UPI0021E00E1E|nr:amidase [Terriglobus tenax]
MMQADESRRRFLSVCAQAGVGATLMPGVLFALATQANAQSSNEAAPFPKLTPEMIDQAAALVGLTITDEQKKLMMDGLADQRGMIRQIRNLHIPNSVAPAFNFDPVPGGMKLETVRTPAKLGPAPSVAGLSLSEEEKIAFASVRELSELVRLRKVKSAELTKLYLDRLKRYDPRLHFVITLTEERALKQAAEADTAIAAGKYKGPLHGIPWGTKDLLSVKGYRTTWGAGGFEQQQFDVDATVVQRLDEAGAVLLAKLTMGALAQGDVWFGGKTRNPWNPKQGSSGSSAGSASSVSAGCVGFAIGTETLGSISSPSTRCGTSGLRPTFGLVPRTGAMALSWSMDKIGPICRSVEDCALVMSAIYGPDGHDRSVKDAAFNWNAGFDWKKLRVGYFADAFAEPKFEAPKDGYEGATADEKQKKEEAAKSSFARRAYDAKYERATLDVLKKMGVTLVPVELPKLPWGPMTGNLEAEAAAAFDELTRSGRDKLLTAQAADDWPNIFRTFRLYSAVDYINAMRARSLGIEAMAKLFEQVDVIVTPSSGMQLRATNLTGHPAVIVPNGLRGDDAPPPPHVDDGESDNIGGPGTPVSITFLGQLYSDARLAAFARAYQEATGFHKLHPRLV